MGGLGLTRPALACVDALAFAQQRLLPTVALVDCAGRAWAEVDGLLIEVAVAAEPGLVYATPEGARPVTRMELERFLSRLPADRGTVVGFSTTGAPLVWGLRRSSRVTALSLATPLASLDRVECRWLGGHSIFHRLCHDRLPEVTRRLRAALASGSRHARGASPEDHEALGRALELVPERLRDARLTRRLTAALERGGGMLADWHWSTPDQVAVRWRAAGREITSWIEPTELHVHSAGICVSGLDAQFDLCALCSAVVREAAGD